MANPSAPAAAPHFSVPVELLKVFQKEVRFVPQHLPTNGYVLFDAAMLKSIILSNDAAAKKEFAEGLDKLERAGGQFVLVSR
jgi:hypothetical protein